jgi:hypothetical protein
MKISFPQNLLSAINREAKSLSLTPGQYIRMRMSELFRDTRTDGAEKSYIVRLKKWREVEAYIEVKNPELSVELFTAKSVLSEMKKHRLNSAEKAEFDRILGERRKRPGPTWAGALEGK